MKRFSRCAATLVLAAAPLLSGCGDSTKRAFGWDRTPPDEFNVVTRAPLTQPPDYSLRPPAPGAVRPQEGNTLDQARKVLVGASGSTLEAPSKPGETDLSDLTTGEQSLLRKSGGDKATPGIRRLVDEETTALVAGSESFTDDILFWQQKPPPGEAVDPVKESKRIESNASLGQSQSTGDTPIIVRKQKGWLEDIF